MDDPQTIYGRFCLGYAMVRSLVIQKDCEQEVLDVLDAHIFKCLSEKYTDHGWYGLVEISPDSYEDAKEHNEDFESISEITWKVLKALYLNLETKKKQALIELVDIVGADMYSRPSLVNPLSEVHFDNIAAVYSEFGYPESSLVHEVFVKVLSIEAECEDLYGPIEELKGSMFSIFRRG